MSEGLPDAAGPEQEQVVLYAQKDREMRLRGGVLEKRKRHLTEKFQKLSANTSGLEEGWEVFLCMYALLKIPRRDGGRDNDAG